MNHNQEGKDACLEEFTGFAGKILAEWAVPGMAVGIVKEGRVLYRQGFGYRDVAKKLPVTSETLFAIGSSTKAFTATSAGMLVDDGKLDLDTPVIEYLSDFRLCDDYATLHTTPRDLLCHRTGMPGYDSLWILSQRSRDEFYHRLRYLEPSSGFRDIFQYSNLMYMAAGVLIGRLSGCSWEEFVADRIFKPLGMKKSNFHVAESQKDRNFSQPYFTFTGETMKVPFREIDALGPGGSINSNIDDMMKWVLLHLNKGKAGDIQIVSEVSLAETHRPNIVIRNPVYAMMTQLSVYGLGWGSSHYRGYSLVEHGGNIDGFSALVSMLPEENIGVVVLSNSLNLMSYVIVREIYDRLLGLGERDWNSHYKNVFAKIMKMSAPPAGSSDGQKPSTIPSLPLTEYTGVYEHPAYGPVKVTLDGDNLAVKFQSGLTSIMKHSHFDVFKGTTSDFYLSAVAVRFHLSSDGVLESLSMPLESGVADISFKRIEPKKIAQGGGLSQ